MPEVEHVICQCIHAVHPTLPGDEGLLERADLEGASIAELAAETAASSS